MVAEPTWPGVAERRRSRLLSAGGTTGGPKTPRRSAKQPSQRVSRKPASRYPPELWTVGQPRLSDLVPTNPWSRAGLGFVGLAIIAIFSWAGAKLAALTAGSSVPLAAPFDPQSRTSLIAWLSSAMLILTAQASYAILLIRRERKDDLRGTYRVWGWVAVACVILSVHSATGVLGWVEEFLWAVTAQSPHQDFNLWWRVPVLLFFAVVGSRLYAELEDCSAAKGLLLVAAGGYGLAYLVEWTAGYIDYRLPAPVVAQAVRAAAHVFLLLSTLAYARRLFREIRQAASAAGASARRQARSEQRTVAYLDTAHTTEHGPHLWQRAGAQHGSWQPVLAHGVWAAGQISPEQTSIRAEIGQPVTSSTNPPVDPSPPSSQRLAPAAVRAIVASQAQGDLSSAPLAPASMPGSSAPAANLGHTAVQPAGASAGVPSQVPMAGSSTNSAGLALGATTVSASANAHQNTSAANAPQSGSTATGGYRKLTKEEKKAIRKRLEELRAAREQRLAQSGSTSSAPTPASGAAQSAGSSTKE